MRTSARNAAESARSGGRDRSVQHTEPEAIEPRVFARDGRCPLGQLEGPALQELGIHQEQRLGRHGGHVALAGELARLRKVEDIAHLRRAWLGSGADDRQIDRAHELLFRAEPGQAEAGGVDVALSQAADVLRIFQGQAGPAAARGQRSRDGQHRIAQRFRIEPAAIHPPQQPIVGIDRVRPAVVGTAHGVGAAQHQAADQALLGPAVRDEPQREGIEQLGVGGRLAARAEVIDRADDPLAEQPLPDAIHGDSRGQWIVAARDPVGQLAAAALTGRDRCRPFLRDDLHEASGDQVAQRMGIAPDRDPHVARAGGIVHGEGDRHGRGEELGMLDVPAELPDAGLQLPPFFLERLPRRRVDPPVPLPCSLPSSIAPISAMRCLARSRSALSASMACR